MASLLSRHGSFGSVDPFAAVEGGLARFAQMTVRKDIVSVLSAGTRSVSSLAREFGLQRGDIEENVRHALRSARAAGHHVVVIPARCRSCGFTFGEEKLSKPSKCPTCRGTRLYEAQIRLERSPG